MAARRKRNVVDDSDSEEEKAREQRKTSLRNFFSPNSKAKAAAAAAVSTAASDTKRTTTPVASPTPVRRLQTATTNTTPTPSPVKASPKTRSNGISPCASSPEKKGNGRGGSRIGARGGQTDERGKSADLVALFSKQAEKVQNSPKKANAVRFALGDVAGDPIVSDDELGDDEIADSSAVVSSYVGNRARKRWKNTTQSQSQSQLPPQPPPLSNSQRFQRPPRAPTTTSSSSNGFTDGGRFAAAADDDLRPWSERFAPTNLDELAVHKKKVADVRRWLEDVLAGRMRQRLLVLKGAAGTGKTTTLRLLAKAMDLDVLEWRNPTSTFGTGGGVALGYSSAAAQFDEFLNRGSRFTQLDLDGASSDTDGDGDGDGVGNGGTKQPNGTTEEEEEQHHGPRRRKIIAIEEFPNTFLRSSTALTGFRNSVLQYLAANTPSLTTFAQKRAHSDPASVAAPVVMIVSETLLTTTSASADSFTAHRLLGPEILRHPGTGVIEFNAIAPSLLAKALEVVVQKEARKSGRRRTPGPLVLRRLGEVGDIRSAVASLEFLCVKGDDDGDWGAKVAFTKGRKGPRDAAMTKGERQTLEMVSQREASLGVFHAVGKVVYNKRDDLPPPPHSAEAAAELLPAYLAHHARPKPSLVSVETLIDETGTDTHTFISALHENYALSCEQTGPADPRSSIDYVNDCIEHLSESDLLCPTWDIFFGGRGTSRFHGGRDAGSHVLRQDEMAFQVAVRGLLFSLPSPVKRSSASHYNQRGNGGASNGHGGGSGGGGGGDQFKMFYPMSLKLWRAREELEALVDVWSSKLLRGEMTPQKGATSSTQQNLTNRALAFRKPKFGSNYSSSSQITSSQATAQSQQLRGLGGQISTEENKESVAKHLNGGAGDHDHNHDQDHDHTETPAPPLLSLGSSARKEMLLERLPYMALIARGKRSSFGSLGMRDLEKVVSFHGIGGPVTAADEADADDDDDHETLGGPGGAGAPGFSAEDAWATDKPTDEASPRKARRRLPSLLQNGRQAAAARRRPSDNNDDDVQALSTGLPMYKLVLSDDDIEDVD
ncbi:cell cycle checkpoint protein [Niveomyces insectorum RCEF 264]|uniref:Cell cycle checkpoint protein n=1 Tax=Niveomyces insectorum RCEF 264 TaxID=1081102 RepID=A0A167PF19_9HYPO|nr:cell cycle checkpoint protein [Niveomyces insectorum RCEF 264]